MSRASLALAVAWLVGCHASTPKPAVSRAHVDDPRADFRPTAWTPFSPEIEAPRTELVADVLCGDDCQRACRGDDPFRFAECALDLAYDGDERAHAVARRLLLRSGVVVGPDAERPLDASYLGDVPITAVVPKGDELVHLVRVARALDEIEHTLEALAARSPRPLLFRTRPHALRFYRTPEISYPSAYAEHGVIGWNVAGPLSTSDEEAAPLLFHEIVHLNDEGHGFWSEGMSALYDGIVERCGDDHACFEPFAPDAAVVPDGTFYAFDERTRDVREYVAEVGTRWYREQRAMLTDGRLPEAPFKCRTPENAEAWRAFTEEFVGGFDLVRACDGQAAGGGVGSKSGFPIGRMTRPAAFARTSEKAM